jgi:hypothetical protein
VHAYLVRLGAFGLEPEDHIGLERQIGPGPGQTLADGHRVGRCRRQRRGHEDLGPAVPLECSRHGRLDREVVGHVVDAA